MDGRPAGPEPRWRGRAAAMAAIVIALGAATMLFGERIGVNRGQGWDGETYVRWAADFHRELFDVGTTRYQAQRVLPSAVVHHALRLAGVRPTIPNIVVAFQLLDLALLVLAAVLWARIGALVRWRAASIWVGFAALFGCFANARHALYYPALTDSAAFALGMAMTWSFLGRRPIALWLCAALGGVTWPALTPAALALLVLRRPAEPPEEPAGRWRPHLRAGSLALALAATAAFLLLARHYYLHPVRALGMEKLVAWVRRDLLVPTAVLLAAYLGAAWYLVVRPPRLWNVRGHLASISWRHVAAVALATAALWIARGFWLDRVATRGPGPSGEQFVFMTTIEALRGPLWGPVHHVVYFGPIIAVAALAWRRIGEVAAAWGPAAALTLATIVAFGAASESRQWIHLLPFLVAVTIAATDERWTPRRAAVFVALALAWSKLWLRIGYDAPGIWHEFPQQRYFMHLGPWAGDRMYLVHLGCAIATALVLLALLRAPRGRPDRAA